MLFQKMIVLKEKTDFHEYTVPLNPTWSNEVHHELPNTTCLQIQGTKTVTFTILLLFHRLLHLYLFCSTGAMFHLIASSNLLDLDMDRNRCPCQQVSHSELIVAWSAFAYSCLCQIYREKLVRFWRNVNDFWQHRKCWQGSVHLLMNIPGLAANNRFVVNEFWHP